MNRIVSSLMLLGLMALLSAGGAAADEEAPWGGAAPPNGDYAPQKVVYDVAVGSVGAMESVLDRVSYLNNLYQADPFEASIVVVLHGDEIPFFAVENMTRHGELMRRAHSLTLAGPIEFRMCAVAARGHGYEPGDIHGFVIMVPMADGEIIKLQREDDYAYMR
ncbi:MAG: hypothetical protein U5S82_17665 [Gammaproteobacteria bacterium]|nr:hypothetical protein [Gammaproteobacteria bacterium]